MSSPKNNTHKIILLLITALVLAMGVIVFFIPPAIFPDPGMGLQVLRCMHLGSHFNTFVSPDQSDISQNYAEYLTWWSPGQYLVPWFFKTISGLTIGKGLALTVALSSISGLAGFYCFFKKIGFTPLIAALSLVFIICQQAFVIPYVFYNGGEILLFAFEGWFLYGCASLKKVNIQLVLFVFLSGWIGFFCKSSFLWIYAAGLLCLWIRISGTWEWVKKATWIGIPAAISLVCIYLFFLSKGTSPASGAHGFKLTIETFTFPIASPILSGFSIDDLLNGLIFHTDKPIFSPGWSIVILALLAVLSIWLVYIIRRSALNNDYRTFLIVFYLIAISFFGITYLRQLNISYEGRHFRTIGILIVPGLIYVLSKARPMFRVAFTLVVLFIAFTSFKYLINGYMINKNISAKGVTGIAQANIDQPTLNYVMKLDRENNNALFVFISDDTGLEIMHNRIITLPPITDNVKFNAEDYRFDGHAGPLYIVLPKEYKGQKENLMMQSFPGYKGFSTSKLSGNYVLYSAN
jgi:hypothetical protein